MASPDRAPSLSGGEPSDFGKKGTEENVSRVREHKPAWSKPSNGAIEIGPVMEAVQWPALSESTRTSPKLSSLSFDPKLTPSSPQGLRATSSPQKPGLNSLTSSVSKSHPAPTRQRSMKRGGDGMSGSTGGASEERYAAEPSPKEHVGKNGDNGFRETGNENHRSFGNGGRRGNNGSNGHHRNNSHFNRRENDWNHPSMNGWDGHIQYPMQPRGSRPYPRPTVPVATPPYMLPSPSPIQGQTFPTHMVFTEVHSPLYYPAPEALSPVFVAPVPLYFPSLDPLRSAILKQIDYYFSSENLCRDIFLRQNMDDQGWVHISLIAGFNRVKLLTDDIQCILDTMRYSTIVEVKGDKIRRRNDWMNWLLIPSAQFAASPTPESPVASQSPDSLAFGLQAVVLEDGFTNNGIVTEGGSGGGGFRSQSPSSSAAVGMLNPAF